MKKNKILDMSDIFLHSAVKKSVENFFSPIRFIDVYLSRVEKHYPLTVEKYISLYRIEKPEGFSASRAVEDFNLLNLFETYMMLSRGITERMMSDVLFLALDEKGKNVYETFEVKLRIFEELGIIENRTMWEHFHGFQLALVENNMVDNKEPQSRVEILNDVYALCCHVSSDSKKLKLFCSEVLKVRIR